MRSSTETLIAAAKELALYIESDDGVATSALREIAERLEELSKERAEMVAVFKTMHKCCLEESISLAELSERLQVSPVTLSKWTATEPTTEPDFVD
jgi:hypothetical protein